MPQGPWTREPPPPRLSPVYLRFAVLIAIGVGVWALFHFFPEVTLSDYDSAWMIRLVAVLALTSSVVLFGRRFRAREVLRDIAIWVAVAGVVLVAYSFRDELSALRERVTGELAPTAPVESGPDTLVLTETENGDYLATGTVNGVAVRFAIDTGASDIVLSPDDARRAGIDVSALSYDREIATANGIGHSADTTVASFALGPIGFGGLPVSVNQAPMATSLLGMAFLRRMKSFEFKGHRLYLKWR